MNHEMRLKPDPFFQIQSGRKTIELRLNDIKRQKITAGDTIIFSHQKQTLQTTVIALHHFPSFKELFEALPMDACGIDPEMTINDAVTEMRQYYSEEQEMEYGVLGIEIRLC